MNTQRSVARAPDHFGSPGGIRHKDLAPEDRKLERDLSPSVADLRDGKPYVERADIKGAPPDMVVV